jgi:hypothetical protein
MLLATNAATGALAKACFAPRLGVQCKRRAATLQPALLHGGRRGVLAGAAAAISIGDRDASWAASINSAAAKPLALPQPPLPGKPLSVLAYLAELAVTERQLAWRLALALVCMIISKGAGAAAAHPARTRACMHACLPAAARALVMCAVQWGWALARRALCGRSQGSLGGRGDSQARAS